MPRHILHYRHGAEHVRCSDKLPYSVLAGAAVAAVISASCPGVARLVGGHRHRTQLVQQIAVLRSLTCGKLCGKNLLVLLGNLGIFSLNALRRQCVKHSAGVRVLVFDDVPRAVLDSLARVASLRSEVIVYALNRFAGFAATIGLLHLHRVKLLHKCGLLVCAADFCAHKALLHSVLHAIDKLCLSIEAVTQAVVHDVDFAFDVGKVAGEDVAIDSAGAAVAAKAVVAPVAAPAAENEEEKNNNPPRTIAAKALAIAIARIRGLNRHCHNSAVRRKTHV